MGQIWWLKLPAPPPPPPLFYCDAWVQGVLEPGSGQEVMLTVWINGGLKGTAQLAAAAQVLTPPTEEQPCSVGFNHTGSLMAVVYVTSARPKCREICCFASLLVQNDLLCAGCFTDRSCSYRPLQCCGA